jgi:RNA polymerase sigma factor (sigma-70 family)
MQDPSSDTRRALRGRPDGSGGGTPPFKDTYLRFAPLLRKVAIRKFNVPPADAETLVHDVFATYFTHADEVNSVERYLIGSICNASRYYYHTPGATFEPFCGETPCAATPTDEIVSQVERKILLSRVLSRVGVRCRNLLHRYYVKGENTKAIADAMQFKHATVLTLLHRCRKRVLSAYRLMSERP